MALTKIKADGLTADLIDETKLADNSIDSEHYNDGSIDNAHLADDAVGVAELSATGTASSSTFLRGDNSWATPTDTNTVTTINNNADNRVITGSGTANTLEGEANLTYNGTKLNLAGSNEADLLQLNTGNSAGNTFASIRGDNEAGIRIRGGGSERGGEIELGGGTRNTDPAVIKFSTNTSNSFEERMRLDSSGRLLLNDGSNVNNYPIWGINGKVQLTGTGWDTTGLSINNFGNNTTRGTIQFMKSKNGTIGNYSTSPATNDSLGTITWAAADTTDANNVHAILDVTTTAPATANNGYGRFVFTTQHGTSVGTRLMIDNDGVKFNGDTAAANALDDYEEGTFSPTVASGGTASSYTHQYGYYIKIGRVVHWQIYMAINGSGSSGGFTLGSFPFTSGAYNSTAYGVATVGYANNTFQTDDLYLYFEQNSTTLIFRNKQGQAIAGNSGAIFANADFIISGQYITA